MEDIRPGQVSRWRTKRAQCGGILALARQVTTQKTSAIALV